MNTQTVINAIESLSLDSRLKLDQLLTEDREEWFEYILEIAELHDSDVLNSDIKAIARRSTIKAVK